MNLEAIENMCSWERQKACFLITEVEKLSRWSANNIEESIVGLNMGSGNVYMWNENWNVIFYMPINCELQTSDIYVSLNKDEDIEKTLDEFGTFDEIMRWDGDTEEEALGDIYIVKRFVNELGAREGRIIISRDVYEGMKTPVDSLGKPYDGYINQLRDTVKVLKSGFKITRWTGTVYNVTFGSEGECCANDTTSYFFNRKLAEAAVAKWIDGEATGEEPF